MLVSHLRLGLIAIFIGGMLSLQGCVLAAAGAGAAGGYEAHKQGYGVQSPVEKDSEGGYKPQDPVTHDENKDSRDDE